MKYCDKGKIFYILVNLQDGTKVSKNTNEDGSDDIISSLSTNNQNALITFERNSLKPAHSFLLNISTLQTTQAFPQAGNVYKAYLT